MALRNTLFHGLLALTLSIQATPSSAQGPANGGAEVAMQVDGLTSAQRDAIARDLNGADGPKLVYACVPAGILLFSDAPGTSRSQAEARIAPIVQRHVTTPAAQVVQRTRVELENACAGMRGQ